MSVLRRCEGGGLLVSARGRLPADRAEYHLSSVQVPCGCNSMRCGHCGAMVRSGPPGLGLRLDHPVSAAELFAAERWEDLAATHPSADSRLYACRCALWECVQDAQLIDHEHESPTSPQMAWECAGHPPPALPLELGELTVGPESSWSEIVARILAGAAPRPLAPTGKRREGPSVWLGWLHAYLLGLPEANRLSAAIGERAGDPDPLVRGSVLYFFMRFPKAEGVARVLAEAEANLAGIAVGYPIAEYWASPTSFDVVVARLEKAGRKRDELDQRARALLCRTMLTPLASLSHVDLGPTDRVALHRAYLARVGEDVASEKNVERLAEYARMLAKERVDVVMNALVRFSPAFNDPELHQWLADHAVAIEQAAPGRWRAVMDVLSSWYKKPALGHLIVIAGIALIESRTVPAAEFRAWIGSARSRHRWVDDAWVKPLEAVLDRSGSSR